MMKSLFYFSSILFLFSSCAKDDDLYYSFDTEIGLEIKNKVGKDLLDVDLRVEKITLAGNNNGGESPTGGRLTPDTPPVDSFQLRKIGSVNSLHLTFSPIYKESIIMVKWKDIPKQDTLRAELYNKNNTVYPRKIYLNGNTVWTEGEKGSRGAIKIEKDL